MRNWGLCISLFWSETMLQNTADCIQKDDGRSCVALNRRENIGKIESNCSEKWRHKPVLKPLQGAGFATGPSDIFNRP